MNKRSLKIKTARYFAQLKWTLSRGSKVIGKRIPVLCYHRVLPEYIESDIPIYSLLPEQFADHMQFLAEQGFTSLSLNEYDQLIKGQMLLPERGVLVTFDDGFADFYLQALPISQRYGIKLNLFFSTGFIQDGVADIYDKLPMQARTHKEKYPELWRALTWNEIRDMSAAGVGLGFHGYTHRKFAKLSSEEMRQEFKLSLSECHHQLNYQLRYFAFPHGSQDSYNNESILIAKKFGCELIFSTNSSRTPIDSTTDLISRLVIYQEDDRLSFALKLFGGYDWVGKLRQSFRQNNNSHLTQPMKANTPLPNYFDTQFNTEKSARKRK